MCVVDYSFMFRCSFIPQCIVWQFCVLFAFVSCYNIFFLTLNNSFSFFFYKFLIIFFVFLILYVLLLLEFSCRCTLVFLLCFIGKLWWFSFSSLLLALSQLLLYIFSHLQRRFCSTLHFGETTFYFFPLFFFPPSSWYNNDSSFPSFSIHFFCSSLL
jgi:hypothetical protein